MSKRLIGLVLGTVALLLAPLAPATAIIGGAADNGEHPYVGQLLFYVPSAEDSRFDDPGSWFNCTGTLIDPYTVVTAGHCTYAVGVEGKEPANPLYGGTDVWFSVKAAPDYSILKPSSTYAPNNALRYKEYSKALDASKTWSQTQSTYTHPDYVDSAFLYHDLGVVKLSEPIYLKEYGTLPDANYLDTYYSDSAKQRGLFESVGYGLEDSTPKSSFGGDTRRKVDRKLVSFKGAHGLKNIAVVFSHNSGGTCFGDSGGPTFDITTKELADQNIIVAVTSFGMNYNCNSSGSYRIDQPEDLAFIRNPAGADY